MKINVLLGRFFPPQITCPRTEELEVKEIKNMGFNKPIGALWTSTFTPQNEYCSDWIKWCVDNMKEWLPTSEDKCWVLIPEDECKIVVINSMQDYLAVLNKYSIMTSIGRYMIDYEKLSKDYDAIHLTVKAVRDLSFIDSKKYPDIEDFYGWDVESTAWFRLCFKKIRKLSEISHRCKVRD